MKMKIFENYLFRAAAGETVEAETAEVDRKAPNIMTYNIGSQAADIVDQEEFDDQDLGIINQVERALANRSINIEGFVPALLKLALKYTTSRQDLRNMITDALSNNSIEEEGEEEGGREFQGADLDNQDTNGEL